MLQNRRSFLKTAVGSALCSQSLLFTCTRRRKPNFVLIMADDLGYGDIGCYGNSFINTPNLDAMAENGLKFTDFHSNGPVCTPTRAALLTGRYQQRAGLPGVIYVRGETRQTGMAQEEYTFAEAIKAGGYRTAIVGKWHLGYKKKYNPVHQGFDMFRGYVSGNIDYQSHMDNAGIPDWWHNLEKVEEEGYATDLFTKYAVQFIEENQHNPFCLYLAHEAPHWPYQGPEDKADRFPDVEFDSRGSRQDRKNAYKEMVEAMDRGIGRVIRTLKRLNIERDTFVFFCSDNGAVPEYGNNSSLRGHKSTLWEGGHRVPAIAYWPGRIKANESTDALALTMDMFPTMLSISESTVEPKNPLDGIDLSPVLFGEADLHDRKVFWQYREQKAMRDGPWKLLIDDKLEQEWLFNLKTDLQEQNNLASEYPDRVTRMKSDIQQWMKEIYGGVERRTW